MFEVVFVSAIILLAILGLGEILHKICMLFFKTEDLKNCMLIKLDKDAVEQTVFIIEEYRWRGKEFAERIIFLSDKLDDETLIRCRKLCAEYDNFIFCKTEELINFIEK